MVRYIGQRDRYSCGPIALMNAAKWAGCRVTMSDHGVIVRMCETSYEVGTAYAAIDRVLREHMDELVSVKRKSRPVVSVVLDHLVDDTRAAILCYWYRRSGEVVGHYAFIPGPLDVDGNLTIINALKGHTTIVRSQRWLASRLVIGHRSRRNPSMVWLLRR